MINLALLRTDQVNKVKQALLKKDPSFDFDSLVFLDEQVRRKKNEIELLQKQKNDCVDLSKKGLTEELKAESIQLARAISKEQAAFDVLNKQFEEIYLKVPNIPDESVPLGNKESNAVVREWGQKPVFDFPIKHHLDLGNALGWFDFQSAAKMTGANFALYKNDAVRLIYALGMFMMKNNTKHGFQPMLPPVLVNQESLQVSGNFPKFKDQVFTMPDDDLFLSPTSEVNLANIYRNQIIDVKDLPIRMTAFTSCFRREAGAYGSVERGLIRMHQFEKVELYSITRPESSMQELDYMIACAETILQSLGLCYRVSLLAAQDCSFQSAKTYDIEVWFPFQKIFMEVSSASNCTDFQARRGMIRMKKEGLKPELVHTLNASSLALPRLMVALMETYQQADGSIILPDVLGIESIF
jgi:seryl-tRNA synthetase